MIYKCDPGAFLSKSQEYLRVVIEHTSEMIEEMNDDSGNEE